MSPARESGSRGGSCQHATCTRGGCARAHVLSEPRRTVHLVRPRTHRTVTTLLTDAPTEPPKLVVELLFPDAQPPERATPGSAGYDLRAHIRNRSVKCSDGARVWENPSTGRGNESQFAIPSGTCALVPLGFKARLPHGIEGQVRPRSG